ncbi:MAG: ATP-binding protein [Methylophilaceae bacterium]
MGRLFWKFFFFLFLAQMTSVIVVGFAVSVEHEREAQEREQVEQIKPQDKKALPTQRLSKAHPHRNKYWFPLMPILVGTVASFIFAAMLAWYFSKPIKQLRQAFASAADGNLEVRVSSAMGARRDELADLGLAFDMMAARLGTLLQSQTHLLHQVSHELRSPLARLQIAVGLARQQPERLESSLTRIERESDRMDNLVGQLLTLSRLESGVNTLEKEPINLNELITNVLEDARFEGDTKQITIDYLPQNAQLKLLGQQDLLHRAIDNVVRNALKFSPSPSTVTIITYPENNFVHITINDAGAGMPENELAHIFEAFYRGSKTQQTDGYGVGLAITKQIIEAHGGHIFARNLGARGLSVSMQLPYLQP